MDGINHSNLTPEQVSVMLDVVTKQREDLLHECTILHANLRIKSNLVELLQKKIKELEAENASLKDRAAIVDNEFVQQLHVRK